VTSKPGSRLPDLLSIACALFSACLLAAGCGSNTPAVYRIQANYTVHDPEFARAMGNLLGPALVPGNSATTLLNGDQIFPAMLADIRSAQKTISFETFIYWQGTVGNQFTNALSERARAGVKVHLLIDWLGSDKIDRNYLKQMKQAGVSVCEYHPLHIWDPATWRQVNNRTHRKLLIIDGRIGFTGGVGIADEWLGNADRPEHWRDNHYRVEGPIVAQFQAAFQDNWMKTSGEVLVGDDYFPPLAAAGHLVAQVFKSSANGGSESMQLMMLLSFAAAGRDIRMESAYFVPDALTRQYLLAARQRGVSVEIIVPGPLIDEKVVRPASRATWGELLKAGVVISEFQPTMFHCKQVIVDDLWVSIGSANMDNRSFRLNDEANLNVLDAKFAAGQIRVFEEDRKRARQITFEEWRNRPPTERLAEFFASLLDWEL
jgi:cardiolipin synthase